MKPEYEEGPDALQKFNELATKLFRAPKPASTKKPAKAVPKPKKRASED